MMHWFRLICAVPGAMGAGDALALDARAHAHLVASHPGWLLPVGLGLIVAKIQRTKKRVF
jgi:hypothetical protein